MTRLARLKETLRNHRKSANPLVRYGIASIDAARDVAAHLKRFSTDDKYRSLLLFKLLNPDVHQTTAVTWMNRYPKIFASCQQYFGSRPDLKILSYGCSTGEEVLTLRQYFPSATITGAEINPRSLAVCRTHPVDDRIRFVHSDRRSIRRNGPFDAVFCLAVLQRTPHLVERTGVESLKRIYPFRRFDRQVSELDALLKPGGLLIVHHAHYRLADATAAPWYRPLKGADQEVSTGPKFGKDCSRLQEVVGDGSIFVKTVPASGPSVGA